MEEKILQGIKDVGYMGALKEPAILSQSIDEGAKGVEYTKLVNFLTNELRSLCNIDEEVNCIEAPDDAVSFMMELSSFLKELGCPHDCLTQGHISDRLDTREDKLLLLDYLLTEMMAARVLQEHKPDNKIELKLKESPQAANLKKMLVILRFPKPPSNITVPTLFQKLNPTVQTLVQKAGDDLLGTPICNFAINNRQWETLGKIQKDLHAEYKIRREMLLKRLDCTIQSFQWSDKMKGKDELINKSYSEKRKTLRVEPDVDISDLLSAREDLAIIEKTSSANVRKNTQTAINKVIIGQVPDRGGRTSEQAPPPPEMPSWQQRQSGPSGGGRGGQRGRGDGNRGGYGSRGGFDSAGSYGGGGNNYNKSGDYSKGQGNYQQGGGYDSSRPQSTSGYDNNRSQSRGGYDNNRSQRGSAYDNSRPQSNYQQTGGYDSNRSQSGCQQSSGGYENNRSQSTYQQSSGGYDSNRSQGGYDNKTSDYNRGHSNYNRGGNTTNTSYDSAGSYSSGYAGSYDNSSTGYSKNFDSAGSYGGHKSRGSTGSSDYQNEPKRVKTYDTFQSNKTTYADQYVQESQHNQQYQPRGNSRGRGQGRSNYSRGGGQQNYY